MSESSGEEWIFRVKGWEKDGYGSFTAAYIKKERKEDRYGKSGVVMSCTYDQFAGEIHGLIKRPEVMSERSKMIAFWRLFRLEARKLGIKRFIAYVPPACAPHYMKYYAGWRVNPAFKIKDEDFDLVRLDCNLTEE